MAEIGHKRDDTVLLIARPITPSFVVDILFSFKGHAVTGVGALRSKGWRSGRLVLLCYKMPVLNHLAG